MALHRLDGRWNILVVRFEVDIVNLFVVMNKLLSKGIDSRVKCSDLLGLLEVRIVEWDEGRDFIWIQNRVSFLSTEALNHHAQIIRNQIVIISQKLSNLFIWIAPVIKLDTLLINQFEFFYDWIWKVTYFAQLASHGSRYSSTILVLLRNYFGILYGQECSCATLLWSCLDRTCVQELDRWLTDSSYALQIASFFKFMELSNCFPFAFDRATVVKFSILIPIWISELLCSLLRHL